MKILIINASDIKGGAARAAYRLHRGLLKNSENSQLLVQKKSGDDYTVIEANSKIEQLMSGACHFLDQLMVKQYKKRTMTFFSPSRWARSNIIDIINDINPDIVHLHWINGGMIKVEDIYKIKAPIVWSLHDMWAFTGGCHYDENCNAYKINCGNCKVLGSQDENDLSRKVFQRKEKFYNKISDLTIVGLSKWLYQCSKESELFKNRNIVNLPNPIDINKFKQLDKKMARDISNLPQDKKLVLYGAMGATSLPRKGFSELEEAVKKLDSNKVEFIIFGSSKPKNTPASEYKFHYLGQLHDDIALQVLYSAADVMVVPSLQENLSNAIMEALSCSTPVVAFNIGGNSDMIEHKVNGYLAEPFDSIDLSNGIKWVLNNNQYEDISNAARTKVLEEFDSNIVVKKYIELYRSILKAE